MPMKALALFVFGIAVVPVAAGCAQPATPQALGFNRFYKCIGDVESLGDTVTPRACLAACEQHGHVAGCWWLDGSGGFPRQCRVCRSLTPKKMFWPNDWALPLTAYTS